MTVKRIATLSALVLMLLVLAALVQALRPIRPSEILPELTAIESLAGQMSGSSTGTETIRKTQGLLESVIAELNSQENAGSRAKTLDALGEASATLAAAERDLSRESLRNAAAAAELGGRVRLIKDTVGSPAALDRLVGMTLKELLIALAWPVVTLSLLLYFVGSASGRANLKESIRQFRSVKLPFMELQIGDDLKQTAEEVFTYHRNQVMKSFDAWVQRNEIRETVNRILEQDVEPFLRDKLGQVPDYRCTLHVPDILFADSLYQLIDYVPKAGKPRGRAWSVRYGMLGKQWRLGKNHASGEIPTNAEVLVQDWGMTRAEARDAGRRQSLVCAILQPENREAVGIFYMDAAGQNAFGDEKNSKELLDVVEAACKRRGLIEKVGAMQEELLKQAPLIRIYG